MSRMILILFFFLLGALLWWAFQITKPLPGVEPKGGPETWMPWLSLAGSIVSLLTAIVTLVLKLMETRKKA